MGKKGRPKKAWRQTKKQKLKNSKPVSTKWKMTWFNVLFLALFGAGALASAAFMIKAPSLGSVPAALWLGYFGTVFSYCACVGARENIRLCRAGRPMRFV